MVCVDSSEASTTSHLDAGGSADESCQTEETQRSARDDASDLVSASRQPLYGSTEPDSPNTQADSLKGRLQQNMVVVRPETREFYEHLDSFFRLREIIEGVVAQEMPNETVATRYEDIKPPNGIIQECVPQADLEEQLSVLYECAAKAKPKFDEFGRQLVRRLDLDPDAVMLVQSEQTWYTYTAVPLKKRLRAREKAQHDCKGDARRLVDIVRASVVVDVEMAFDAVVKCLHQEYVEDERDGVRVVRFKNRCKNPLADGKRDVLYNMSVNFDDGPSPFVCELQIHMKQILDYKEATQVPYAYFRSYFKGGGDEKAVKERVLLLEEFVGRNADDISEILESALDAGNEDHLEALDELFEKLSELEIVVLIRRRLHQLVLESCDWNKDTARHYWLQLAHRLDELAWALQLQGKYQEAKPLCAEALRITQDRLGHQHPNVAALLNNLPELLRNQGKYDEAKPLLERAVQITVNTLGHEHPDLAIRLNNLANLLYNQGKYDEAKPLLERAIQIGENTLGSQHPELAKWLNNLALLLTNQGKYDEAKPLLERAIQIGENTLGLQHPNLAKRLNNLANLLYNQGNYDEAKPLVERAIQIGENALGSDHPDLAAWRNNLANLLLHQGKYDKAKPLLERAIQIRENTLGPEHPLLAASLSNLARLLTNQGKYDEARPLLERAIQITENTLGPQHPDLATWLNNLAGLLESQGKCDEAKPLLERVIQIGENTLGFEHPYVATRLNDLANLLNNQGKYDEAKPLLERAIQIGERTLGHEHPDLAIRLTNLASLLEGQGNFLEALALAQRAAAIFHKTLGPGHPYSKHTDALVQEVKLAATRLVNQTHDARSELQQDVASDASGSSDVLGVEYTGGQQAGHTMLLGRQIEDKYRDDAHRVGKYYKTAGMKLTLNVPLAWTTRRKFSRMSVPVGHLENRATPKDSLALLASPAGSESACHAIKCALPPRLSQSQYTSDAVESIA